MASFKEIVAGLSKTVESQLSENPIILISVLERMPSSTRAQILNAFCPLCHNRFYGKCACEQATR